MTKQELLELNQKLCKSELVLYLYIKTLEPFGKRYEDLSPAQVMVELGISKTNFYRAISRLQELNLIDVLVDKLSVRDLNSRTESVLKGAGFQPQKKFNVKRVPKMGLQSQKWDSSPKNGTPVPKMGKLGAESHAGLDSQIPLNSLNSLNNKKEREKAELFEESGEPVEEYRDWLTRRSQQLPSPPPLLEQWIESQAKKRANQRQFLKFLSAREKLVSSAPEPAPVENFEAGDPFYAALERNRVKWTRFPAQRKDVIAWIESESRATLGEDGPMEGAHAADP